MLALKTVSRYNKLQGLARPAGRTFVNHLHFQDELDRWVDRRANGTTHRTLRCRPIDGLEQARPQGAPDLLVVSTGTGEANREHGIGSPLVLDPPARPSAPTEPRWRC